MIAINYAEEAVADKKRKRFGKWIRLAAKRFLGDLKRAQKARAPFVWSAQKANEACEFIEQLPHVEGSWKTENIQLEPAQIFFVVQLFGFRNQNTGRRFTTALLAEARKNAKTTLAAAILLLVFCTESENGPEVLSAAMTGAQARIVWRVAKRMVERTEDLRETFDLEPFANAIACYESGGTFKPINAKASSQDGLNPSALCFDELHAHKTHDLLNVLMSAAGARDNPLFLYTTTEGYETPGPWPETREFAKRVLERIIDADHFLAIYYALDDDDDEFDESKWIKANPLIESNPVLKSAIKKEAIEAKQMPGRLAEFRIKRLNRQASSASGCINLTKWKRCKGEVDLEKLTGVPCWASLDLASTTDMNSWRLLWLLDDHWYTWGRYWVPEDAVRQRTIRGTVPYASWVASGLLTQTSGDVADYDVIRREIITDCERFGPQEIPYDPWNATQLASSLIEEGLPLVQFIQGPRSYHPGWQAFELAYTSGKLSHAGHPILTWNAANLVDRRDANDNFAPDRRKSADKIDGMVTLLMCFGRAALSKEETHDGTLTVV